MMKSSISAAVFVALVVGLAMVSRASASLPAFSSVLITSEQPPAGTVGVPFGAASQGCGAGFLMSATGGSGKYQWVWSPAGGSAAPAGLSLSPCGPNAIITGVPTMAGTYTMTVMATDEVVPLEATSVDISIRISPRSTVVLPPSSNLVQLAPHVTLPSLPTAQHQATATAAPSTPSPVTIEPSELYPVARVGSPFSMPCGGQNGYFLTANGRTGPYTWSVSYPQPLPDGYLQLQDAGLTLQRCPLDMYHILLGEEIAVIYGNPMKAGVMAAIITATDRLGNVATINIAIRILPSLEH
jgi:hypothetical protein